MDIKFKSNVYETEQLWREYSGDAKKYYSEFTAVQREFISILLDRKIKLKEQEIKQEVMEDMLHFIRSSKNMAELIDSIVNYKTEIDKLN